MNEQIAPDPEGVAFYHWVSAKFPEGLTGEKNAIPVTVDENEMGAIIFEPWYDQVSFGLFLPTDRYSRKTLLINSLGQITEDTSGIIPDFDKSENEPEFTSSNEEIVKVVSKAIRDRFPDEPNHS